MDGFKLHERIAADGSGRPVIFLTAHPDEKKRDRARAAGATAFLEKPVEFEDLRAAIAEATAQAALAASAAQDTKEAQKNFDELTPRQQAVFRELLTGAPNKVIAFRLGIGERTVKAHRQALMERLGASSVSDVVAIARKIGLSARPD